MPPAVEILQAHGRATERYLQQTLARLRDAPSRLIEAMEYSLFAGGKRLRPALLLETERAIVAHAAAGDRDFSRPTTHDPRPPFSPPTHDPRPTSSSLAAAAAIELIHTFSLVHDDLPAMDDDDLRRGRPTNHKVFGDDVAILAGDAMTTVAFELIASDADESIAARLINELAAAAGPCGMIGGQILDMAAEKQSLSIDQLKNVHQKKTGALIVAACRMGCICAEGLRSTDNESLAVMTAFARHLGLAFQIVDDILDATGTPAALGKATQKDASRGKNTFTSLLGPDAAAREANNQLQLSLAALAPLGAAADGLRALASFVVARQA